MDGEDRSIVSAQRLAFRRLAFGIVAWMAVMIAFWPATISFDDETGYVGEARLLLLGRLMPRVGELGLWLHGTTGLVDKYPLFPSLLLAPWIAIAPRLVFVVSILAAAGIAWVAARALASWGDAPTWGLLLIAHPTLVLVSRTAMADVPMSAFTLGAWWALRQNRRASALFLLIALILIKPTGVLLAACLGAGELLRRSRALRRRDQAAWSAMRVLFAAYVTGAILTVVSNKLTTGGLWYGYGDTSASTPLFHWSHFKDAAPEQWRSVLFFPPLLILGLVPLWRRREFGPVCVICGFGGLMCFYFFVDRGATRLETLVLAPRLILPVVVFLLVGYTHLLAVLCRRYLGNDRGSFLIPMCVALPIALAISFRHHRWQEPMGAAVDAATDLARDLRVPEVAVTPEARKVGIMIPGPVRLLGKNDVPLIVLCTEHGASHRLATPAGLSCEMPGYRAAYHSGGFALLVRDNLSTVH